MESFEHLSRAAQLGLTVYSPDCQRSDLTGALDQAIHAQTGFEPVYRLWIKHDINSVRRFYSDDETELPPDEDPDQARQRYARIPPQDLQYGHLVVRLLMSGPSLLTLWRGDDAIPTIRTLKGATQPAEASPESIRGRFWCDNGVCNLIHSSDDEGELRRELTAVDGAIDWSRAARPLPLFEPSAPPTHHIAHSGLSTTLSIANRLLTADGEDPITVRLPEHGRAAETHHQLASVLHSIIERWPGSLSARLATACLTGDLLTLSTLAPGLPATKWELMVMQCAAVTRESWQKLETSAA